ncbi:MAG: outer membrane beta-barrel protein [Muribaculaceae bacterium]|nr:outer membrane beta-barrel protein [Muribaculaceae bacterium]
MKKVLLSAVVVMMSFVASAQVWMGGSLGLDFTSADDEVMTTFSFAPEVGYTLNDKWDIAIALNESFVVYDDIFANSISVEPYVRYTFAEANIASFFVEGGIGIGATELGIDGDILGDSATEFYIGFRPGVKVALSEKVGLVAKLGFFGYQHVTDSYSNFGLNINNNSLTFGMYWNF